MPPTRQILNKIDYFNAQAAVALDRAVIEARIQIEEADELLAGIGAIKTARAWRELRSAA
jgi:hypothetical protein